MPPTLLLPLQWATPCALFLFLAATETSSPHRPSQPRHRRLSRAIPPSHPTLRARLVSSATKPDPVLLSRRRLAHLAAIRAISEFATTADLSHTPSDVVVPLQMPSSISGTTHTPQEVFARCLPSASKNAGSGDDT